MPLNPNIPLSAKGVQAPNILQMMQQAEQNRALSDDRRLRKRRSDYTSRLGDLMQAGQGTEPMNVQQANQNLMSEFPMLAQAGLDNDMIRREKQMNIKSTQGDMNLKAIGPTARQFLDTPAEVRIPRANQHLDFLKRQGADVPDWLYTDGTGKGWTTGHDDFFENYARQYESAMQAKGMGQYSKSPFYYQKADGSLGIGQLKGSGGYGDINLPEGAKVIEPVARMDVGGSQELYGTKTGETKRTVEKTIDPGKKIDIKQKWAKLGYDKENLALRTKEAGLKAKELEQKIAAGEADKIDAYESYADKTNSALQTISEIINHEGLSDAVGLKGWSQLGGLLSEPPAGTKAADFLAKYKKIAGAAFIQAFASIKGGGHITEVEGEKATQAITEMNTSQSEKAFIQAAKDFEAILKKGKERARKKYLKQISPKKTAPTGLNPSDQDLLKKYGVDLIEGDE